MNDRTDLSQRLERAFGDPALGLTPRPGAADALAGRVRTIQRRRRAAAVVASAAAAVTIAVTANALSGPAGHSGAPAGQGQTSRPSTGSPALTGTGVDGLRLGLPVAQLAGTGLIDGAPEPVDGSPGCSSAAGRAGVGQVLVSDGVVVSISVGSFVPTAEGVSIGDSWPAARVHYPEATLAPASGNEYRSVVPGHPGAIYRFTLDSGSPARISGIDLDAAVLGRCASR